MAAAVAKRISGSLDLYGQTTKHAYQSINFVTCHDGFTLNDLVSYNDKHNEANLEDNRDGTDANYSWNCGLEDATNDPNIEELRLTVDTRWMDQPVQLYEVLGP